MNPNEFMNPQIFAKFANVEQFEAAFKSGQKAFDEAYATGKESAHKAMEAGTETLVKGMDQWFETAKNSATKLFPQSAEMVDQAVSFNRDNFKAALEAGALAAKGTEMIGDQLIAYGRSAVNANLETLKDVSKANSFQEAAEMQTAKARETFDSFTAESTKLAEAATKAATEASQPLMARAQATQATAAKAGQTAAQQASKSSAKSKSA